MHMIEPEVARAIATDWIASWNAHDLDRVLEHYTEDVELTSPYVTRIAGEPSGKNTGKSALRANWAKALAMLPEMEFTLKEVLTCVATETLVYRGHRGTVAETIQFDAAGRVHAATACYDIED